jgi:hypothetical protein
VEVVEALWPSVREIEAEIARIVGEEQFPAFKEALGRLARAFPA